MKTFQLTTNQITNQNIVAAEVGNVPSKCAGITHYWSYNVLKSITFSSNNGSNFDRAITFKKR